METTNHLSGFTQNRVISGSSDPVPLGIYAKSITPPPPAAAKPAVLAAVRAVRAERYALLSSARKLISAAGRASGLKYGHDLHKTAKCRYIRHGGTSVEVHKSREHGKAFYCNLITCGSVWSCPVCAAKIQERRREEIAAAINWAYDEGLQPVMVTLTFPHRAWHKLRDLLDQQAMALQRLRAGQPWEKFKKSVDFRGLIRSLELTHGDNGWHPHTHELWFVRSTADASLMLPEILKRWESACIRAGLLDEDDAAQLAAFRVHAVDVKGWCSESDYLAKQDDSRHWGADREIAKGSTKAGRAKGRHAFGLLADASGKGSAARRAGRLYLVYIAAMRGKRQIVWSKGLKALVKVDDLDDETLAVESRDEADLLGYITDDDWHTVRTVGAFAAVLDAAEVGGWPAVQSLIDRLTLDEIARMEALLSTA